MAGVRFFAGYPITPSTEIAEYMALKLPRLGGVFIQMEDEIASITAAIGASAAGMLSMTATSGPGLSLMQEGIGYACMVEVPCLVVDVQRGGPATGLPTKVSQADLMAARWGTHGDHPIVALCPSSVYECFELTVRGVGISERLRLPVILLMDEVVGHMREVVELPKGVEVYHRRRPSVPREEYLHYGDDTNYDAPFASFGQGYRLHLSGLTHRQDGFPTNDPAQIRWKLERLRRKVEDNLEWLSDLEVIGPTEATVIVCFGSVARSAKEAITMVRSPVGLVRLRTIWPFPSQQLSQLMKDTRRVVVPELNQGQLIHEVERALPGKEVIGVNRFDGELLTPEEILEAL